MPVRSGVVDLQCLFTLNETGGFIWEQLAEPRTIDEIAAALVETFDVEREQAERDTQALLTQLVEEGCAHMESRAT